ncbi:MAG: ABC transporter ATP-binding protein [Treponema sp.]|nr:ABC transporter ATP-binding protein [Treponema sp.]
MKKILEINHLSKQFNLEAGFFSKNKQNVFAVNDVSFSIDCGSTYGIVGESGCGKTTTARMIIQMYKQTSGEIFFYDADNELDKNVSDYSKKELRLYREKVKYIFQDPARSLNPRMNIYDVLTAGLRYSSLWKGKKESVELCEKIIQEVGLSSEDLYRRPSEFSGGQRQRISIARGLIMNPQLLICDEVVSALDVSIQGQIINLLTQLKENRNLSYIFISHDLKVACFFSDVIGVMYRGVLVEEAPAKDLYKTAVHPYTKLLFAGAQGMFSSSNQEVQTTLKIEECCPFAYRCSYATDFCKKNMPHFKEVEKGHKVRCVL